MHADYKVRYLHDDLIASAAAACWKAAPPTRPHMFDAIKVIEKLVASGIESVFHIKGDRLKGRLELDFFDREWWDKPAWVTFGKSVKLTVDRAIWAAAKAGDSFACFVLAHEIGHILLHDNNAKAFSNNKADRLSFVDEGYSAEAQANSFAGHALIPTATARKFDDAEMLAILCNAPLAIAVDRLDAVRKTRFEAQVAQTSDYCSGCGNFCDVSAGTCSDCSSRTLKDVFL
jgi:hypothetical protein